MEDVPPLVLDSARVLSYVIIPGHIAFVDRISLFVDGVLVGRVPRLAICQQLGETDDFLLLHCDDEWNSFGAGGGESVEDIKASMEKNYPGLSSFWVDRETTEEDALRYYDETWPESRCTVCGKRAFERELMIEHSTGMVCAACDATLPRRNS